MLRFNSPPPNAVMRPADKPPGSAPERLQRSQKREDLEMQEPRNILKRVRSQDSFDGDVSHPDYYMKLPCGYRVLDNNDIVEPILFQPTPKGLQLLIDDFTGRTGHRLEMLDQAGQASDTVRDRFQHARARIDAAFPQGDKPAALILSYGQMHAVPVLLFRQGREKHLVIFDSTSGGIIPQYYAVANTYPDFKVMLNRSTRQADTQSCITDAFEILCRALAIDDIGAQVLGRATKASPQPQAPESSGRPRIFKKPRLDSDNFYLFGMPEALCFTAQRSEFLNATGADRNLSFMQDGVRTTLDRELRKHREISHHGLRPAPGSDARLKLLGINSYLYEASRRHKRTIDRLLAAVAPEDDLQRAFSGAAFLSGPAGDMG